MTNQSSRDELLQRIAVSPVFKKAEADAYRSITSDRQQLIEEIAAAEAEAEKRLPELRVAVEAAAKKRDAARQALENADSALSVAQGALTVASHNARVAADSLRDELRDSVPRESREIIDAWRSDLTTMYYHPPSAVIEERGTGKYSLLNSSKEICDVYSNFDARRRRQAAILAFIRQIDDLFLTADVSPTALRKIIAALRESIPAGDDMLKVGDTATAPIKTEIVARPSMNIAAPGHPIGEAQ